MINVFMAPANTDLGEEEKELEAPAPVDIPIETPETPEVPVEEPVLV
jgi:hypothetical protein